MSFIPNNEIHLPYHPFSHYPVIFFYNLFFSLSRHLLSFSATFPLYAVIPFLSQPPSLSMQSSPFFLSHLPSLSSHPPLFLSLLPSQSRRSLSQPPSLSISCHPFSFSATFPLYPVIIFLSQLPFLSVFLSFGIYFHSASLASSTHFYFLLSFL